jgi:hypothetical protein
MPLLAFLAKVNLAHQKTLIDTPHFEPVWHNLTNRICSDALLPTMTEENLFYNLVIDRLMQRAPAQEAMLENCKAFLGTRLTAYEAFSKLGQLNHDKVKSLGTKLRSFLPCAVAGCEQLGRLDAAWASLLMFLDTVILCYRLKI